MDRNGSGIGRRGFLRTSAASLGALAAGHALSPLLGTDAEALPATRLAQTAGSWRERFNGAGLPPTMVARTAGNGTVTVTGGAARISMTGGAASAGALVGVAAISRTRTHAMRFFMRTSQNSPHAQARVFHQPSGIPAPDTEANLNARECWRIIHVTSTTRHGNIAYRDTAGVLRQWQDSTKSWVTGGNIRSTPPIENDSVFEVGWEIDVPGARIRWFWFGIAAGATKNPALGWRLIVLTDWVALSAIRNGASATRYWTAGWLRNDMSVAGDCFVEAIDYAEGERQPWVLNEKDVAGSNYQLRLWESVGDFFLPVSRTGVIIDPGRPGMQPWFSAQAQFKAGIKASDGYYYLFFNGRSGTQNSVGVARSRTPFVESSWATGLYPANPIIRQSNGTNKQNLVYLAATQDQTDVAARRLKLFVTAAGADGKTRIYLYYAPLPSASAFSGGTWSWTEDGILAQPDSAQPNGYGNHIPPIWHNGQWLAFGSGYVWRGPRLRVSDLVRGSARELTAPDDHVNASERATSISSTSRTIGMASTAGFEADAFVVVQDGATVDAYWPNRIRRVNPGGIETYLKNQGYTTAGPPWVNQFNAGRVSHHYIAWTGSAWKVYTSGFQLFDTQPGTPARNAHMEGLGVYTIPTFSGRPTWDWLNTGNTLHVFGGGLRSSENPAPFVPPQGGT